MKILKAPETAAWRSKITCAGCKAELEVELADLTLSVQQPDRPSEGLGIAITCHCPICCRGLWVSVPPELHHAIKKATTWEGHR